MKDNGKKSPLKTIIVDEDEIRPPPSKITKTLGEGKPWAVGVMAPFTDMCCAEDAEGNVVGFATENEAMIEMVEFGVRSGYWVRKGRQMFHADGSTLYVFHIPSYNHTSGALH